MSEQQMSEQQMSEQQLGWSREGDTITIRMTRGDYDTLLLLLGAGTGVLLGTGTFSITKHLGLLNRINAGNPNYRPYCAAPDKGARE